MVDSQSAHGNLIESENDLRIEVRVGTVNPAEEGIKANTDGTDFMTVDTAGGAVVEGEDGAKLDAFNALNTFLHTPDLTSEDGGNYIGSYSGADLSIHTLASSPESKCGAGI